MRRGTLLCATVLFAGCKSVDGVPARFAGVYEDTERWSLIDLRADGSFTWWSLDSTNSSGTWHRLDGTWSLEQVRGNVVTLRLAAEAFDPPTFEAYVVGRELTIDWLAHIVLWRTHNPGPAVAW